MHITKIIPEKCTGCEDCVFVCPHRAIKMEAGKALVLDGCTDCKDCWHRCPDKAIFYGQDLSVESAEATSAEGVDWRGVLVWLEADGAGLSGSSRELLAAGRQLADGLGVYLEAFLTGPLEAASEAIARGADRVHRRGADGTKVDFASRLAASLLSLVRQKHFEIVLFPDTFESWEVAPRIAQKLETVILPPAFSLSVDYETRDLAATIHAYGGKLFSEVAAGAARPQIALVSPRAFPEAPADPSREGEIQEVS